MLSAPYFIPPITVCGPQISVVTAFPSPSYQPVVSSTMTSGVYEVAIEINKAKIMKFRQVRLDFICFVVFR